MREAHRIANLPYEPQREMTEHEKFEADTYEKPAHGWTCFHCGETFTTPGSARDHFGAKPDAVPGCIARVSVGGQRGLLMLWRKAEEELAELYRQRGEDDTPILRELYRLQGKHSEALRVSEEAGYERGLNDAKADSAAEIADLRYRLEVAERDADAFRLMARLNINVSYRENVNGAWVIAEHEGIDFCPESLDGPHEYDATRSAILRAAAAIEEPK
jgi:hypothetical protein